MTAGSVGVRQAIRTAFGVWSGFSVQDGRLTIARVARSVMHFCTAAKQLDSSAFVTIDNSLSRIIVSVTGQFSRGGRP